MEIGIIVSRLGGSAFVFWIGDFSVLLRSITRVFGPSTLMSGYSFERAATGSVQLIINNNSANCKSV